MERYTLSMEVGTFERSSNEVLHAIKREASGEVRFKEIDVDYLFFYGGSYAGTWYAGVCEVLAHLEKEGVLKYTTIHGVSAGSLAAVFYVCGIRYLRWISVYHFIHDEMVRGKRHSEALDSAMDHFLPVDSHLRCSGRVVLYSSRYLVGRKVHWEFSSRDQLMEALRSSFNIPGVSRPITDLWRRDLDGVFGHIIHGDHRNPRQERGSGGPSRSLRFQPPLHTTNPFFPSDRHIQVVALRGYLDALAFFRGGDDEASRTLSVFCTIWPRAHL